ncbi:MAG TPA: stage II sporulation protein M [Anaerolineales bacterium]|nr:stage II sporulation protein M [Anaerolineales bacterium]
MANQHLKYKKNTYLKGVSIAVIRALSRARFSILAVGLTYLISVSIGILMVQTGNQFAVSHRDRIVSQARSSPAIIALDRNDRFQAALLDFGGNLLGALSSTLSGLGVIAPFPIIAYRGWIGGIVSIDSLHGSRLMDPKEALYYLTTLVLQLIPYTLAGGIGVNLGLAYFRPKPYYQGGKWLGIPKEALRDIYWIYLLVVPLFLIASLWEFEMR